jgi:hypothetical protein
MAYATHLVICGSCDTVVGHAPSYPDALGDCACEKDPQAALTIGVSEVCPLDVASGDRHNNAERVISD